MLKRQRHMRCLFFREELVISCLLCIWIILCRPSLPMGPAHATAITRAPRFVFFTLTLFRGNYPSEPAAATAAGTCELRFTR